MPADPATFQTLGEAEDAYLQTLTSAQLTRYTSLPPATQFALVHAWAKPTPDHFPSDDAPLTDPT